MRVTKIHPPSYELPVLTVLPACSPALCAGLLLGTEDQPLQPLAQLCMLSLALLPGSPQSHHMVIEFLW